LCIDRNNIDASIRKSALEQMTIVMFLEIVSNLTHALGFLLFDRSLRITSLSDQEFQQQKFSIDFVFILILLQEAVGLTLIKGDDRIDRSAIIAAIGKIVPVADLESFGNLGDQNKWFIIFKTNLSK
ncbi:unnamed protein product, partial [Rotaria magnacalcarata]